MELGWGDGGLRHCSGVKLMSFASDRSALFVRKLLDEHNSWTPPERRRSTSSSQCSTSRSCHSHHASIPTTFSPQYVGGRQRRRINRVSPSVRAQVSLTISVGVQDSALEVIEWRSRSNRRRQDEFLSGSEGREGASVSAKKTHLPEATGREEVFEILAIENSSENYCSNKERGCEVMAEEQNERSRPGGWRSLALPEDVAQPDRSSIPSKRWRKLNSAQKNAGYTLARSPPKPRKKPPTNRDRNLEILFEALSSSGRSDRGSAIERYFESDSSGSGGAGQYSTMETNDTSRWNGTYASNSAREKAQADDPAIPLLPKSGERLKINLELDLYRARCLKTEGRSSEAEEILKQCIKDWPDDGRAYLGLGLLALPLRNDQMSGGSSADNRPKDDFVTSLTGKVSYPGDGIAARTLVEEGSGVSIASLSAINGVATSGERLKVNLDLQLYQAKCLRRKGRLDVSEAILRKCIRDWSSDGRPYVALGKQFAQQNRIQDARDVYDSGCQAVRGENPYIWQAWAVLEEKAGHISKARKLFDASTVADKNHVAGWHGWAKLELRAGNIKRARSLLNKGLRQCGPNEYIFQTLASLAYREGGIDLARSLLSKAVQFNPKSAPSWLAWGLMEAENNIPETARRLFQKGIEASPKNRYVWQAWALFEAKQGEEDRARKLFQTGRELNPKDAVILQAFALFEYKCGRPLVSRDLFRRALNCDSSHQPVYIAWGWMEWKLGNLSVARDLYQGAIRVNSRSPDAARAFQAWGVLEDRAGDSGLSRELFRCALRVDSQNVPALMSWAAMEDRAGRSVRADEIRLQFLQQRTEVVESSWDVDISDLLAPAIDRIKGFFKGNQRARRSEPEANYEAEKVIEDLSQGLTKVNGENKDLAVQGQDFDVESFLKQKFPQRFGCLERRRSSAINLAQKPID